MSIVVKKRAVQNGEKLSHLQWKSVEKNGLQKKSIV